MIPDLDMDEELLLLSQQTKRFKARFCGKPLKLNHAHYSQSQSVVNVVNILFDELNLDSGYRQDLKRKALNCIITNLFLANHYMKPVEAIFSKNHYTDIEGRYTPKFFTYTFIVGSILKPLLRNGYVVFAAEGFQYADNARYSKIMARKKLLDLIPSFSETDVRDMAEDGTVEVIQLKDEDKNLIDYDETETIEGMRRKIRKYNSFICAQNIKLEVPETVLSTLTFRRQTFLYHFFNSDSRYMRFDSDEYDESEESYDIILSSNPLNHTILIHKLAVKRIFNNGSFEQGGRLYGSLIQGLPKMIRKHIELNDESIAEPDYSALHLRMLYHREGTECPMEDPYMFGEGENRRELNKAAVNIMLNSSGLTSAKRALRKKFRNDDELRNLFDFDICSIEAIDQLIQDFRVAHPIIIQFFYGGEGIKLQRLDSDIMLEILDELVDRNIPAIPIHDSVMVPKSKQEEVMQVMIEKYEEKMNFKPIVSSD